MPFLGLWMRIKLFLPFCYIICYHLHIIKLIYTSTNIPKTPLCSSLILHSISSAHQYKFFQTSSLACSIKWFLHSIYTHPYHLFICIKGTITAPVQSSCTLSLFFKYIQILCIHPATILPPLFKNFAITLSTPRVFPISSLLLIAFISSLDTVSCFGIYPPSLHPHTWYSYPTSILCCHWIFKPLLPTI